ncbi:calcitonin gene-related peptide type 1 receptor-like isoform X2 [Babylonia areolata]|uniref:calcitonin gene-related peptide type 1 receptor-like isoform X2 n=1 Tax=Babylonia areolata TaxID=304850 RepID=UPI003FD1C0A2
MAAGVSVWVWFRNRTRAPLQAALPLLTLLLLTSDLCPPSLAQSPSPLPPYRTQDSSSPTRSPNVTVAGVTPLRPEASSPGGSPPSLCRDRLGAFPPRDFGLWSCGFCLHYLYSGKSTHLFFHARLRVLVMTNASQHPVDTVLPDVTNASHVSKVCGALSAAGQDCQRWVDCCRAAWQCCARQQTSPASVPPTTTPGGEEKGEGVAGYCPATWDGYRCWDAVRAGSTVSTTCPAYIEHASTDAWAHKRCQENGTWYVSPESQQEWTDYTGCIVLDHFWALFWVGVTCNVISLVLLLPACFIFMYFRSLRSQHRIKLHMCLFLSYVLTNVLMILWEVIVVKDRLQTARAASVLHVNSVGCRVLHALTRYAWTTNFVWMFLEGLHLYRLMVHAFAVPRSLLPFYIGGFSSPWIPTLIYICIRATSDELNTRCWVSNAGGFEWIIYVPIILCLAGNIFFLAKILYVMMTQLQSHPNEPSSYRRAAKAAAILVPLFGLQVVMVIARPQPTNYVFEIFSKIVTSTQGALVAIGFCYLNGEVLTVIRSALPRSMRSRSLLRSDQRSTMSTQFTTDAGSRSHHPRPSSSQSGAGAGVVGGGGAGYIPLSTLGDEGRGRGQGELERLQHNGSV